MYGYDIAATVLVIGWRVSGGAKDSCPEPSQAGQGGLIVASVRRGDREKAAFYYPHH